MGKKLSKEEFMDLVKIGNYDNYRRIVSECETIYDVLDYILKEINLTIIIREDKYWDS